MSTDICGILYCLELYYISSLFFPRYFYFYVVFFFWIDCMFFNFYSIHPLVWKLYNILLQLVALEIEMCDICLSKAIMT